jgi:D-amino peptidase
MTSRNQSDYEKGRKLMAADVNAAIEGILSVVSAEITVSDAHGGMNNMLPEDLHKDAILVRGRPKPQSQMAGINKSFDACIFVGYHSMKGTMKGILSHTYSGRNIQKLVINGIEVGETAMNAGIAGYYGVPLIFVSGDFAVTEEAKSIIPNLKVATVKKAISRVAAECLHPEKARELIKENVSKAIKEIPAIKPFKFDSPVVFEIEFANAKYADSAAFMPSIERINGKTVRISNNDYIRAYHGFLAANLCATSLS